MRDITEFARRFDCDRPGQLRVDGGDHHHPPRSVDACDRAGPGGRHGQVLDAETGRSASRPVRDRRPGKNWRMPSGEIVETSPASGFEGYYKNEEATHARFRGGAYWSGDLAYRDERGLVLFCGTEQRVAPGRRRELRGGAGGGDHRPISWLRSVAVYAVPDDPVGDRVMAAVELEVADPSIRASSTASLPSSPTSARNGNRPSSESSRSSRSSQA